MQLGNEEHSHLKDEKYKIREQISSDANEETLTASPLDSVLPQLTNKHSSFAKRFWEWSGFGKKTLWDILQFFAIFIPLVTFVVEQRENNQVREENYKMEAALKVEEFRRGILSDYLDEMKGFLLEGKLRQDTIQIIARAETLSVLRQLDGERRGEIIRFLYEANVIGNQCQTDSVTLQPRNCQEPILNISGARLEEIIIKPPIPLQGIDLARVSLANANLPNIDLTRADMREADLEKANLAGAILADAQIGNAQLIGINLSDAILVRAVLPGSVLNNALLMSANLQEANLSKATLIDANLQGANLNNANLQGADLRNADLTGTFLQGVNLQGAVYNDATKFPEWSEFPEWSDQ